MQRLFWLFSILLFTCLCTQRSGIEKTIEMIYESGREEGGYLYDIFNPEGVFIRRTELSLNWAGMYFGPKYYTVRNHKLYCYRENEDGFPELIVYEIGGIW